MRAQTLITISRKSTLKSLFFDSLWDKCLKLGNYVLRTKAKLWSSRFLIKASEVKTSNFENVQPAKNHQNWRIWNFKIRWFHFWGLNQKSVRAPSFLFLPTSFLYSIIPPSFLYLLLPPSFLYPFSDLIHLRPLGRRSLRSLLIFGRSHGDEQDVQFRVLNNCSPSPSCAGFSKISFACN